ncbi:glycosyltransferase family 2 protein [Halobaculum halobium]|uniref:Glycosyltransferase family 2 protein n=1 Tax=Halobaculum halobium TaxID=3032281 RepID=A0ABD5T5C3_9EURY|nr:glycosyltransferase [Halobaculum sp. SYNS20]
MVELSVVVPTLKSREDVESVRYLARGTFDDYEVLLQDESPVTCARNEGIRRASAEKIVFLDDDSRPARDYLDHASAVLDEAPAYAGRTVHPREDLFSRHFTPHYHDGIEAASVDCFWGCNMGVRREVFETVGGWDEGMRWGHEEKELADRVRSAFEIRYDPRVAVEHPYADSVLEYWNKQYRLETQTPYYWRRRGLTAGECARRIADDALDPRAYLRTDAVATGVQIGARFANTAGRIVGLVSILGPRSTTGDVPAFEPRDPDDAEEVERSRRSPAG